MLFIEYAREVGMEVPWKRAYRCESCGAGFVSVYNVYHTTSKMIDLLHDDSEKDYEELKKRVLAEMPDILEKYHPRVRCPACGAVPGCVRACHRANGLKRGMVWGLVAGIVGMLAGLSLPGPMGVYLVIGLVGGPVLGSLAGWCLSDRLFLRWDVVYTKEEWEKHRAGSATEPLALLEALRQRR